MPGEITQRLRVTTADDDGTAGWDSKRAAMEAAFAPGTVPFDVFVESHGSWSRERFLEAFKTPYLLISGTPVPEVEGQIMTQAVSTKELEAEAARVRIAPLVKRANSNSFTMMITLGRTDNNDVTLKHTMISKFHAYFRHLGGQWVLSDSGSLNGTTIDGRRLPPERAFPIKSRSRIVVGGAVAVEFLEPADLFDVVQLLHLG